MRLSIVVPAHNEERRIGPMLEAYLPFFSSRYGAEVEFIVVINGSTDRTDQVVAGTVGQYSKRRLSETLRPTGIEGISQGRAKPPAEPLVKVIVEPKPIGKGGALMEGFRQARGDLIGFVDADGATPPSAFQELVDKIGDAGGIIASRWAKGSQVSPRQPLARRVASRVFNVLTRVLFGLRLTDTQCGAKLMRREAVAAILPSLGITQWAFDVDLLFQLRRSGYAIKEIPTTWHDVEGSKIQVGKASSEMILALTRLRLLYSRFRWVVGLYDRYLGPWIHPVGAVRDYLFTHSLMLFIGAQFGNICNLLFQVFMARMLDNADYGVLFAVLSVLMMLGMPLGALGGAVTHFTALFMTGGPTSVSAAQTSADGTEPVPPRENIKAMMIALVRDLLVPSLIITLGIILARDELMSAFKIDSPWPVYIAGATAIVMLLGAVPSGVLAGMQEFEWVALIGNGWMVLRLVLGVVLALIGLGAAGGLTAHMVGLLVAGVLSFGLCRSLLSTDPMGAPHASLQSGTLRGGGAPAPCPLDLSSSSGDGAPSPRSSLTHAVRSGAGAPRLQGGDRPLGIYSYMGGYMAAFAAYGVLTSADVLLVKYYFPPEQAGVFAKAAMVARMVFFLPGPVCSAMFPKVTSTGASSGATRRTLFKAMVLTGLIVAAMGLVCLVMPGFLLKLLAKEVQPGQVEILRGMVLALTPLTLLMVLLNYELAQRRFRIMLPLSLCAAGYLAGVMRWHQDMMQVVAALGVSACAALGLCLLMSRRRGEEE